MIRVLLIVCLLLPGLALAQSVEKSGEKPRLKDFGSSLKKLKWDPEKNATSEVTYGARDDDGDVIKIDTLLVVSELLVLDKNGRVVSGLKASDFAITEEGAPQQVGHFLLGDNRSLPRSIVLIIDYSGSQFPYIRNSVDAASVLVDKLGPRDRMAIVTDDVELLVGFTNDKRELKKKLNTLLEKSKGAEGFLGVGGTRRQFGKSAQYSALMATLKEAFDEEDQRPIIIFQTDGDEAAYACTHEGALHLDDFLERRTRLALTAPDRGLAAAAPAAAAMAAALGWSRERERAELDAWHAQVAARRAAEAEREDAAALAAYRAVLAEGAPV